MEVSNVILLKQLYIFLIKSTIVYIYNKNFLESIICHALKFLNVQDTSYLDRYLY